MSDVHRAIAQRMGSLRDDFNRGFSAFDEPGPEITVRPFGAGTVSPEAGVLKAITRIAATRRQVANLREARIARDRDAQYRNLMTKKLERDLAEPTHSIVLPGGGGTVGGLSGPEYIRAWKDMQEKPDEKDEVDLIESDASLLGLPVSPTGKYDRQTVLARQATQRIIDARNLHASVANRQLETGRSRSRYAAANVGIRKLDEEEERGAENLWQKLLPSVQGALRTIQDERSSAEDRERAAATIGMSWSPGQPIYTEDVNAALDALKKQTIARGKKIMRARTAEKRKRFQATIDAEGMSLIDPTAAPAALSPSAQALIDRLSEAEN